MSKMVLRTLLVLVLLSDIQQRCEAKKVVFISPPVNSHVRFHFHVARALVTLRHQVWVAVPTSIEHNSLLHNTNISVIPYKLEKNYQDFIEIKTATDYFNGNSMDVGAVGTLFMNYCDEVLRNQSFSKQIRDLQTDLIVLSNLPFLKMMTVLPYKLSVPFAMVGSFYDVQTTRIPCSPAVTPSQFFVSTDNMTFFQRLKNAWLNYLFTAYDPFTHRDMVSIYAPEKPFISNDMLVARAEIWLVQMNHILDYPRPTLPNVKLIGGMSTGPAKVLPPEFKSFMDSTTHGVVVVTFGGEVLDVPRNVSDKLMKVFLRLPTKVIFRSGLTSPNPAKIMTSKWLPQNDLLGHPNTKVFVSHCGNNGQHEALYHSVPLVCTPISKDQPYNAERIRVKGFGEVVDLKSVSEEELFNKISKVSNEPRYKQAISKASILYRQQYGVPAQEAAKWLDHVMQYGGEYMRYAGQKIPLYQVLMLDVLAFIFVVCFLIFCLLYFCLKLVWRCCLKRKQKSD